VYVVFKEAVFQIYN